MSLSGPDHRRRLEWVSYGRWLASVVPLVLFSGVAQPTTIAEIRRKAAVRIAAATGITEGIAQHNLDSSTTDWGHRSLIGDTGNGLVKSGFVLVDTKFVNRQRYGVMGSQFWVYTYARTG